MESEGRGVLHCCGERLTWELIDGTSVLEVTCAKCGAVYAMDPDGDERSEDDAETAPDQPVVCPHVFVAKEERFISDSSVVSAPHGTRNAHTF